MIWHQVFVGALSQREMYRSLVKNNGKGTNRLFSGLMSYHCSINASHQSPLPIGSGYPLTLQPSSVVTPAPEYTRKLRGFTSGKSKYHQSHQAKLWWLLTVDMEMDVGLSCANGVPGLHTYWHLTDLTLYSLITWHTYSPVSALASPRRLSMAGSPLVTRLTRLLASTLLHQTLGWGSPQASQRTLSDSPWLAW